MENQTTYTCPNCGATITNSRNCEYCGSLLVRFAAAGIDLSETSYTSDAMTLPGLKEALKLNLQKQRYSGGQCCCTDIYKDDATVTTGKNAVFSVITTGLLVTSEDQYIYPGAGGGLAVIMSFDEFVDGEETEYIANQMRMHDTFKALPSCSLFQCFVSQGASMVTCFKRYEYAIDFGEDYEGAARLISEIAIKVYGCEPGARLEYYTNVGEECIEQSRSELQGVDRRSAQEEERLDKEQKEQEKKWLKRSLIVLSFCLVFALITFIILISLDLL